MKFLVALIATIAVTQAAEAATMNTNAKAYACIEALVTADANCATPDQCVTDGKAKTGDAVQTEVDACAATQNGACSGVDLAAAKKCAEAPADNSTVLSAGLLFVLAALAF